MCWQDSELSNVHNTNIETFLKYLHQQYPAWSEAEKFKLRINVSKCVRYKRTTEAADKSVHIKCVKTTLLNTCY